MAKSQIGEKSLSWLAPLPAWPQEGTTGDPRRLVEWRQAGELLGWGWVGGLSRGERALCRTVLPASASNLADPRPDPAAP